MKLRIRGNSVRMRVTKAELAQIAAAGHAEDSVRFSPDALMRYCITVDDTATVAARLEGPLLTVTVPRSALSRWLEPEQVSIVGEQDIGGPQMLKILVEKDFECLAPRAGEDDSDLFVNPLKAEGPAD
jgi:hypothetical protein